ncbi:MAG: SusC/RagA family TonB-linked outer membrane protein [Flavobacteriaceae bacterium]
MKYLKLILSTILIFSVTTLVAQQNIVGTVTDTNGNPLPAVSVVVQGTADGVSTDFDGQFSLQAQFGESLVFSSLGFQTQVIEINRANIDITLLESTSELDEVVVIGYGSVSKKEATGAVAVLSDSDFNSGKIVSSDELLAGKVAGLVITNNGGNPDSAPNIRIRGGASLNASNNPLIVIDGIPLDIVSPAGVSNPFTLINPNDIASFSVLKDASATSIYGSRASNGVILISTKKGQSGEPKYSLTTTQSLSVIPESIDVMDGPQFADFIATYHPTHVDKLGATIGGQTTSYNTDWQDAIFRQGFSSTVNLSVTGGKISMPWRVSVGHTYSEGLLKNNDYERLSSSFRLSPVFLDGNLNVDFNTKLFSVTKNSVDEGGALGNAISMDPTKPIYDESPDNRFAPYYQNTNEDGNQLKLDGQWNPVALLMQRSRPESVLKVLSNLELDYNVPGIDGLSVIVNAGLEASSTYIVEEYDNNSLATYRFDSSNNDVNSNYVFNPGKNYREDQNISNSTLDTYLSFDKTNLGAISSLSAQLGYSYQNFKNEGTKELYKYNDNTGRREVLINENNPTNRYFSELNLQSFFGRANIGLYDNYLFTFSLRADASSLFTEENRWGYFPSAAFAWQLGDEDFISDVDFINDLKIRVGWGETGQQDITGVVGYYPSIPLFELGSATSQYLPGENLYSAKAFNPDLTWEKTTTINVGVDFSLFDDNRLQGSVDVFQRETSDLLATVPVAPGQALSSSFVKNVGDMESQGIEASLSVDVINAQDANLNIFGNFAYIDREVKDLKGVERVGAGGGLPVGTGVNIGYHAVGHQPYAAWVFRQLYDTDGNPVYNAFADLNGDNQITNDDRYFRNFRPDFTFGFGMNLSYKKASLSTFFRGQYGGQVYNGLLLTSGYIDRARPNNTNSLTNVLDFNNGAADPNFLDNAGNVKFSDYYLEDASFIRCESISLGYDFGTLVGGATLNASLNVNNAFLITKYSGRDPENFGGIDHNFYPRPQSYTLGINIDF